MSINNYSHCPFCGSTNTSICHRPCGETYCYWIKCEECFSRTGELGTAEMAWKAWEKRVGMEQLGEIYNKATTDRLIELARLMERTTALIQQLLKA
jgi:hypothetical protein